MNSAAAAWLGRLKSLLALAAMVVALSLMSDKFFTVDNWRNILLQISLNLCLSIGMTLIILTGGIDLSVGAILALAGAVAAGLLKNGIDLHWAGMHVQFTPVGAIVGGIIVGLVLGWHNGIAITRFRLPPFVATLGMLSIGRGLTMLWTRGFTVNGLGPTFGFIGAGSMLHVPMAVWISAFLVILFYVISSHTQLGRYIYAVGGSERAAAFSGLNVDRVKIWVYTISGGLAAVAGLVLASRLDAADPNAGVGYELDSIAAVVIGGTSLSGGRGSVFGTVIGCLIIGVLNNGLVQRDVPVFWQQVIKGYVILVAVAVDMAGRRTNQSK